MLAGAGKGSSRRGSDLCLPFDPDWLGSYSSRILLFQERQQGAQEGLGILHLRYMADARQNDLAGVNDIVVQQFLAVAKTVDLPVQNHR